MLRLLVILFVLASAIGFAPVASAQSTVEPKCHSVPAADDREGKKEGHDGTVAVAHVCVGCAFFCDHVQAGIVHMPEAVPLKPNSVVAFVSFNGIPISPPPRA
jgi:hypothetical protein